MNIPIEKFESWLRNKNLKERTIEEYIYYFSKFTDNVFNQETISRFLASKSNRNPASRSFLVNLKKFILQNYKELGFTIEQRLDASEVEFPQITGKKRTRITKTLTSDEILQMEKYFDTEKEKLMLLCTYFGGLRCSELLKIKVLSFNWNEWKKDIKKVGECRVLGKGDREGIAFFPPAIMIRIAKYIKSQRKFNLNSTIFIKNYENFKNIKCASTTWEKKFRIAGIKAGIIKLDGEGKVIEETAISPHVLRHSYGSNLLKKGVDIRKIQELMRHSKITSTEIYTHINKEDLKEEVGKLFS